MKQKKFRSLFMLSSLGLTAMLSPYSIGQNKQVKEHQKTHPQPNILLIVADDLGFSDCGCFGGEIKTPHIDSLATSGIRFSRFHTSSLSAPTRSMLLTGVDTHLNGLGCMPALHATNQYMKKGYEGYLNEYVMTLPEVLRQNGYHTYMTGKWHLGLKENTHPSDRGFEHSFTLLNGGASHFADAADLGSIEPPVQYSDEGKEVKKLPDSFFSSDFYATKMIEYIDSAQDGKPFFGYLAFTAPHDPLQVPDDWMDCYKGKYDVGYEIIREQRLKRMKEIGIIPDYVKELTPSGDYKLWDSLSKEEQKMEARKMEIFAAMVENMDYNIGRVLQHLEDKDLLENTLILFMSDNGANPHDVTAYGEIEGREINNSYENMGRVGSFISEGTAWANVSNTPLSYFKTTTAEGGINTPLIISGQGISKGIIDDKNLLYVADIMPTLLELVNCKRPNTFKGKTLHPLFGESFANLLNDKPKQKKLKQKSRSFCMEMMDSKAVFKDNWKARMLQKHYGNSQWELFDLSKDITESRDLSNQYPDILKELINDWDNYKDKVGYIPRSNHNALDSLGSVKRFYEYR